MIYICYITYVDNVVTFVLTVRDDDDALLEVARERAHVGVPDSSCGWANSDPVY
jgi:hypothetical protein